jgi:uncharacterized protein
VRRAAAVISAAAAPVVIFLLALAPGAAAFDCASAAGPVERRICADAVLRALDSRLDELLERTRARSTPREVELLKSEQRAWLSRRNGCTGDDCLRRAYEARVTTLQRRLALRTAAESPLERCSRVAASRLEVDACLDHLLAAVERDLAVAHGRAERVARELAARQRDGALEALAESDAAWAAFRDVECRRQADPQGDAATAADVARSCRIALAEWRMLDLLGREPPPRPAD